MFTFQNLNLLNMGSGEVKTLTNIVSFTVFADGGDCTITTPTSGGSTLTVPQGSGFSAEVNSMCLFSSVTITCNSGSARLVWVS